MYYGAHVHLYQHTYPVNINAQIALFKDASNSSAKIYQNPHAPVYVYVGTGGSYTGTQTKLCNKNFNLVPLYTYDVNQIVNTGYSILTSLPSDRKLQNQFMSGNDGSVL
jgi:hypothetical protein